MSEKEMTDTCKYCDTPLKLDLDTCHEGTDHHRTCGLAVERLIDEKKRFGKWSDFDDCMRLKIIARTIGDFKHERGMDQLTGPEARLYDWLSNYEKERE